MTNPPLRAARAPQGAALADRRSRIRGALGRWGVFVGPVGDVARHFGRVD